MCGERLQFLLTENLELGDEYGSNNACVVEEVEYCVRVELAEQVDLRTRASA